MIKWLITIGLRVASSEEEAAISVKQLCGIPVAYSSRKQLACSSDQDSASKTRSSDLLDEDATICTATRETPNTEIF